jgi:GcrA cell cycle regulator
MAYYGLASRWTVERTEQLKALNAEGLSASQIAAQLGVTRNAVMGKLGRLGVAKTMGRPGLKRERVHFRPYVTIPTAVTVALAELPRVYGAVTLAELNNKNCHWPLEPGFCGAEAIDGKPYCGHHSRVAYRKAGEYR